MKRFCVSMVLLCLCGVLSSEALAAGETNVWANGYPKPGTMQGFLVKGQATAPGYTFTSALVTWSPTGGGVLSSEAIPVDATTGAWGERVITTNVTSGVKYNVTVQVNAKKNMMDKITVATDTKEVTAK